MRACAHKTDLYLFIQAGYLDRGERLLNAPGIFDARVAATNTSGIVESLGNVPEAPRPLTLLVTGDEDGMLILSINGHFPVARLQLEGTAAVAVACCTSGNLHSLYVWVQTVDGPKLQTFDMEFLAARQREVCVS